MASVLTLAAAPTLQAQVRYRVIRAENFRDEAGSSGRVLASLRDGVEVAGGDARDGWVQVALDGWVWGPSLKPTDRNGFDLVVASSGGENLRTARNGTVVARLREGFLLEQLERDGDWVRARRSGWVWARSLGRIGGDAATGGGDGDSTPSLARAITARPSSMGRLPDSLPIGTLAPETPVRILSRSGEWVRVQVEGWVREADLRPGAGGVLVGVSGSEIRARPREFEGKVVQWVIQFLSLATADELRPEIPAGQRYMLARGPMPEAGFIYVTLTATQIEQAQRLPPLAEVMVVARVRHGRSAYVGNPVVELVDMAVRKP